MTYNQTLLMGGEIMSEKLETPIPDKCIKLPVSKIIDHGIQFKAHDGSYHETSEGLQRTNEAYFQQTHRYKSGVLGREYPATFEGAKQMREDEAAYWESQKIKNKLILIKE